MTIFERIRESCERVVFDARSIELNVANISVYEGMVAKYSSNRVSHTSEHHLLGRGLNTLIYFLVLDTINFGSGYFPHLRKIEASSGYYTVAKHLKDWFLSDGTPSPRVLHSLAPSDCHKIFRQEAQCSAVCELMVLFARALNDLGALLLTEYKGDYREFFGRAKTAEELIYQLLEMPLFRDVHKYRNHDVYILKRGQILVQDVSIAEPDHPLVDYPDVSSLTAFADNLIPFVLRCDGILLLSPELERQIEAQIEIVAGSDEEIELRAASVVGVDIITKHLKRYCCESLSARTVDFMLWYRGQDLKRSSCFKRHRTRSPFY